MAPGARSSSGAVGGRCGLRATRPTWTGRPAANALALSTVIAWPSHVSTIERLSKVWTWGLRA